MSELRIKNQLPLGIAWTWVKFSFATFRETPINFLVFALSYIVFSILPFIGSFLAVFVLVRMYLSADKLIKNESLGLKLNIGEIFAQRNVLSYAIFTMGFDLLMLSIMSEIMASWGVDSAVAASLSDSRVLYLLIGASLFKNIFFGISLSIIAFNAEIKVLQSVLISWKFMFKNCVVLILALFLLLPFLVIPLYLSLLLALSVTNLILFGLVAIIVIILMLLFISVTSIFSYKLYQDGISK